MKKPTEAIKRWRDGKAGNLDEAAIIAYLDSIPEWPADLTRERLEELAGGGYSNWYGGSDALRRLAAIAPKQEKRKVEIWLHASGQKVWKEVGSGWNFSTPGWHKVGEAEIDA